MDYSTVWMLHRHAKRQHAQFGGLEHTDPFHVNARL
jgi:hypothetical protein